MIVAVLGAMAPGVAAAHTEPNLVAVPAGAEATVSLMPTHGCGESPTVSVRIRAPLPDASAGDVEGWTATTTPDGAGNTVLEWAGGPLPTDEEGAFPVTFFAPEEVGRLLTFPAIQICANGEELAWIDGDPAGEYPAPRVLVLPPDYEPAETLDDVPLDAPGREQLAQVIDVDNPQSPTTVATVPATAAPTVSPTTAGPTTAGPSTSLPAPTSTSTTTPSTVAATTTIVPTTLETSAAGSGSSAATPILIVAGLAVVGGGGAAYLIRRRSSAPGTGSET